MTTFTAFTVFVLWVIFCVWFWQHRSRAAEGSVAESWSTLASQTGLVFTPGSGRSLLGAWSRSEPPNLAGTYRGRHADLRLVTRDFGGSDSSIPVTYTIVTVDVDNPRRCTLDVHEKPFLSELFSPREAEVFDLDFQVEGKPTDFVGEAEPYFAGLVSRRPTAGSNSSPFFWTSASKSPRLTLRESELKWQQYDMILDADDLKAILDELCDLAEFTEKNGHLQIPLAG